MKLPLISIIVSNYNYEKYIDDAIQSVKDQRYPHVECIIVDDCSTDGSRALISSLCEKWPDIKSVYHQTNLGQSAAALTGLSQARGQYVVFLDADDVLAPDFVETHLAVHLCSAKAVGFTCCDSLQVCDDYLIRGRDSSLAKQFSRPADASVTSQAPLERLAQCGVTLPWVPPSALRYVSSRDLAWAWSTTSCMFFRRDAVEMVCGAAELGSMRIGTDNYLATVTNLWTGSIVIDRQLVDYRIHGKNGFAKRIQLHGFAGHDPKDNYAPQTMRILFADLEARFRYFVDRIEYKERFVEIFAVIQNWLARSGMGEAGQASPLAQLVSRNREAWVPLVGAQVFADMLEAASSEDLDAYLEPRETPPGFASTSGQPAREMALDAWLAKGRQALPYRMARQLAGLVRR